MKIFIDTGNFKEIEALVPLGIIDGVTTNPTLMAKEGGDPKQILKKICDLVQGPVSGEVVEVNEALRADPSLANTDPLGNGWFFKVHVTNMGEFDQRMDQPAYDVLVKNS